MRTVGLPNDRPHMFRVMGTIDVPRTGGLTVSGNLQYFSGKPWAATTQVSLPQGDQRDPARTARVAPAVVADRCSTSACRGRSALVSWDASS